MATGPRRNWGRRGPHLFHKSTGFVANLACPTRPVCSYTLGRISVVWIRSGGTAVQTAQPRDLGALVLVVGMLVILLLVTLMFGSPAAAVR